MNPGPLLDSPPQHPPIQPMRATPFSSLCALILSITASISRCVCQISIRDAICHVSIRVHAIRTKKTYLHLPRNCRRALGLTQGLCSRNRCPPSPPRPAPSRSPVAMPASVAAAASPNRERQLRRKTSGKTSPPPRSRSPPGFLPPRRLFSTPLKTVASPIPPASHTAFQRHRIRKPGYPGYAISGSAS